MLVDRVLTALSPEPVIARATDTPPAGAPMTPRGDQRRSTPAAEPGSAVVPALSIHSTAVPLGAASVARQPVDLPVAIASATSSAAPPLQESAIEERKQTPAWGVAVGAGKAVAAGSEQGAMATAGFFTRVVKQVGRSF